MPDPSPTKPSANPNRARDLILVVVSFLVGALAIVYHNPVLALVGVALFWLAVLDSTSHQKERSKTIRMLAIAALALLAVVAILAGMLLMRPRVRPVNPASPTLSLPAPAAPPPTAR